MIALKLKLQSLAAIGAVTSFVGGGVLITKNINSSEKNDFYLVSRNISGGTDHETKINNSELWIDSSSENNKTKIKNYFCNNKNKEEDEDCDLYSLKVDETTKVIPYSKIKAFISENTEANFEKIESGNELKMENFFLLKTKTNFIDYNTISDSNNILLQIKQKNGVTENISLNLKIYSKISSTQVFGIPKILIAKAENLSQATEIKKYSCFSDNETTPMYCNIQLIGSEPSDQNPESLSFENYTQTKPQQQSATITPNFYYGISFSADFMLPDLKNKKQIWVEISDPVNPQKVKFLIKSAAFLNWSKGSSKTVFIFK